MSNTTPTTVPPNSPTATTSPYAGIVQGGAGTSVPISPGGSASGSPAANPADSIANLQINLNTTVQEPWGSGSAVNADPFGIGVDIHGPNGLPITTGTISGAALETYLLSLSPAQIQQVQADLANAGYYGTLSSTAKEPQWGTWTRVDDAAITNLLNDGALATAGGGSLESMMQLRTKQWAASGNAAKTLTPVKDLGSNFNILQMDPNQAGDTIDQAAMKVLGSTLPESQRNQLTGWLQELYSSRQIAEAQGKIAQNTTNAQAQAQASDLVNPATGQPSDTALVSAARSQLGVPYVWGGTAPGKGLDCSGLAQYVYKQSGINLPRTSQEQWANGGGTKFTDQNQLVSGDLVFFVGGDGTSTAPGHVGIYIGNGMMIDAAHTGTNVRIDSVANFGGFVGGEHFAQASSQVIQSSNLPVGTSNAGAASPGGSNAQTAYQFFVGKGLTPAQAAGIVGSMQSESGQGLDPEISQGGGGPGRGIAQWSVGGRWDPALMTGNPGADLQAQLNKVWSELTSTEGGSLAAVRGASSPEQAALAFTTQFERPANPNDPARQTNARNVFAQAASGNWGAALGTGAGSAGAAVSGAATGLDANGGRSILSTPNTFTNVTDYSPTALNDALQAQLRAMNPAMAAAHDSTQAYTMLTKTLRDGIAVNNA